MKQLILIACAFLLGSSVLSAQAKAGKQDFSAHATFYTCPMHPGVVSDKQGKCPKCGMDLFLSQKEELKSKIAKTNTCPIHADAVTAKCEACPDCGRKLNVSSKEQMKAGVTRIYTCPMHSEVVENGSGKCQKCGMTLTQQ